MWKQGQLVTLKGKYKTCVCRIESLDKAETLYSKCFRRAVANRLRHDYKIVREKLPENCVPHALRPYPLRFKEPLQLSPKCGNQDN